MFKLSRGEGPAASSLTPFGLACPFSRSVFATLFQKEAMQFLGDLRMFCRHIGLLPGVFSQVVQLPVSCGRRLLLGVLDDFPIPIAERPAIRFLVPDPVKVCLLYTSDAADE